MPQKAREAKMVEDIERIAAEAKAEAAKEAKRNRPITVKRFTVG